MIEKCYTLGFRELFDLSWMGIKTKENQNRKHKSEDFHNIMAYRSIKKFKTIQTVS